MCLLKRRLVNVEAELRPLRAFLHMARGAGILGSRMDRIGCAGGTGVVAWTTDKHRHQRAMSQNRLAYWDNANAFRTTADSTVLCHQFAQALRNSRPLPTNPTRCIDTLQARRVLRPARLTRVAGTATMAIPHPCTRRAMRETTQQQISNIQQNFRRTCAQHDRVGQRATSGSQLLTHPWTSSRMSRKKRNSASRNLR